MDYLTGSEDQSIADQELAGLLSSSKVEITESKGAVAHGVKGTILNLKTFHIPKETGILPLLFEGKTAGKGVLTVHVYKSGTEVAKDKIYLNLLPITKMYDHYTADPSDSGDESIVGYSQILTKPRTVTEDETTHKSADGTPDTDYVLFVHGWRMQRWERIAFAQTAFKRLWHLGYKGRFGFFSWPTEFTGINPVTKTPYDLSNYDDSEQKAYISAQALHFQMVQLKSKGYSVHVLAHSMGNIVTSEALRLEVETGQPQKLVQTYVASQAAVAAQAYDANAPTVRSSDTLNVYAFYPSGHAGSPYFGSINLAVGTSINFFNSSDYALDGWNYNQASKPDHKSGYNFKIHQSMDRAPKPPEPPYWTGPTGFYHFDTYLPLPEKAYEVFAKAAPAYSLALGAQAGVGGPFSKSEQVDLNQACGFTDKPNNHSAQFEDTFSKRQSYWEYLLKAFQLGESVPN